MADRETGNLPRMRWGRPRRDRAVPTLVAIGNLFRVLVVTTIEWAG